MDNYYYIYIQGHRADSTEWSQPYDFNMQLMHNYLAQMTVRYESETSSVVFCPP